MRKGCRADDQRADVGCPEETLLHDGRQERTTAERQHSMFQSAEYGWTNPKHRRLPDGMDGLRRPTSRSSSDVKRVPPSPARFRHGCLHTIDRKTLESLLVQCAEPVKDAVGPTVQYCEPADLLRRQRPGLQCDHPAAQRRPPPGFDVAGHDMGGHADLA